METAMNVSAARERLILFDVDCTLLQARGAGREATRLAMQEVFGTTSRLDTHAFDGKTDWQTLVELLEEHDYDEVRIGDVMHHYEEAMGRHMAAVIGRYAVEACAGALELVARLRRQPDTMLGVVTGNVSTVAPVKLRAAGFDPDWFPVGAFGNEAANRDDLPPLALARAVAHYQRDIKPEQVIIVGDTAQDIACARALGAVAVAVATGPSPVDTLAAAQPDYLLVDLTTFEAEVLSISERNRQV